MMVSQHLWMPIWSDPARFSKRPCLGQNFQVLSSLSDCSAFRGHPGIQCPSHFAFNHYLFELTSQPGCCSVIHIFLPQNPLRWSDSWFFVYLFSHSGLRIPSVTETKKGNTLVCSRAKAKLYISNLLLKSSRVICWEALEITHNS